MEILQDFTRTVGTPWSRPYILFALHTHVRQMHLLSRNTPSHCTVIASDSHWQYTNSIDCPDLTNEYKKKKMCTANGQLFVSILLCSVFAVTERQRFCRFSSLFAPNTIDRFLYLIYIVAASRYTYPNYARINQIDKEQIAFKHNKHHSRTIHFWFECFARCDKSRSIFQAKL